MKNLTDFQLSLASAYALIRGNEENVAVANLTLDNLITDQISRLKGDSSKGSTYDAQGNLVDVRQTRYEALTQLETRITSLVQAVNDAGSDYDKLTALGLDPTADSGAT